MQKKTASPNGRLLYWEEELMGLIKAKILAEAGTSMRAHTNMSVEEAIRMLQKNEPAASGQK